MSSLTMVGTAYVRKYLEEDGEFFTETFDTFASTNDPLYMGDLDEDFHTTIAGYDWEDIPDEEGLYAVQYAATLHWTQDYWGEIDCEADVHWSKITRVDDKDAEVYMKGVVEGYEATREDVKVNTQWEI